jgi:Arc/MetJ-type ribon-helix-helix transcriptional regulator
MYGTCYGTLFPMTRKTTVYLPDDLKDALEREARRRGSSEAEVIRTAIADAVARPRPTAGIIDAPPMADHVDELLEGFGER